MNRRSKNEIVADMTVRISKWLSDKLMASVRDAEAQQLDPELVIRAAFGAHMSVMLLACEILSGSPVCDERSQSAALGVMDSLGMHYQWVAESRRVMDNEDGRQN